MSRSFSDRLHKSGNVGKQNQNEPMHTRIKTVVDENVVRPTITSFNSGRM